jgi:hypothetical protein
MPDEPLDELERGRAQSRQLAAAELDKVRREIASYKQFVAVKEQIAEVPRCDTAPLCYNDEV